MRISEGLNRIGSEEPDDVRRIIDSYIKDIPLEATGKAIKGFRWQGEQGTIFHWTRLLDRLDEFLSYCTDNIRTLLDPDFKIKDELPVPDEEVIDAIECTIEILRNVAGKEHYNSLSQLCDLLACSNPVLVNKVLVLMHTMYQRNISGYKSMPPDMANRLQSLAAPMCGPSLIDVAKQDVSLAREKDRFHFRFSIEPNPSEHVDERTEEEKQFGDTEPKLVKFERRSGLPTLDFEALETIMSEYGPVRGRRQRFRLLRNIRASAVYDFSDEELELEACNRFLAVSVLVPVGVLGEVYGRVHETFRKLGSDDILRETFAENSRFSEKVRLHSIYAFTSKFIGSERSSFKMDGLDKLLADGKYSPLGTFLQKNGQLSYLNSSIKIQILEETIVMINALCNLSYICEDILETGILENLMPFLETIQPEFAGVRRKFLTTIEVLFTNSTAGIERLGSCKGFEIIQERLALEIASIKAGEVGYEKRFLVKKLMKTLTRLVITSETSGIDETKVGVLYNAMHDIFKLHNLFGPGIFDAATTCFRQIMHHEPLQYKTMSSIGLDVSYLDALSSMSDRDGFISLNIIPTISAICLSETGRNLVKTKNAVHLIADTFTNVHALCSLPASQTIGRAIEELIRHHETMMGDVVEMLVSSVDTVRKISCTGEIEVVLEDGIVKDLPRYISIAISRVTEMLTPVCESNSSAAKAFLDQGGLQVFVDLVQPNLSVDCFCCTQAATNIMMFLRTLLLLDDRREYVVEVILSESRKSLQAVNKLFAELENQGDFMEDFYATSLGEPSYLNSLMKSISKSVILIGSICPTPISSSSHKSSSLSIDQNLCILPELEIAIASVINILTKLDEWRIETDIKWRDISKGTQSQEALKETDREVETRRDALNQFFRASCQLYNGIGRISENAKQIWGNEEAQSGLPQNSIAYLSASTIIRNLEKLSHLPEGIQFRARKQRHCIRLCRLITSLIFDHRKKSANVYLLNAFVRFGGLDLLLKILGDIANECLEICLTESSRDSPFVPTIKEIKEQERQLEITGIGRVPLSKDLNRSEWLKRSLIISSQHSFLSILGILEIITAKEAYKTQGPKTLTYFGLPYWVDNSIDARYPDLVTSICRRSASCFRRISLSKPEAWALCPLPLTKFIKSLANCQKNGHLKENVSDEELVQSIGSEELPTFEKLISDYPSSDTSVLVDVLKHGGTENCFDLMSIRSKNRDALQKNDAKIWVFASKEQYLQDPFTILAEGNFHAAKSMIKPWDAEAHLYFSIDRDTIDLVRNLQELHVEQNERNFVQESFENLLQLMQRIPLSVHEIADLVVVSFSNDMEALKTIFQTRIISATETIKDTLVKDFSESGINRQENNLAPLLHLLVAVLNISTKCRKVFNPLISSILKLLDVWKKGCISSKKAKVVSHLTVPKWVDASLLSLGLMFEERFKPLDESILENSTGEESDLKTAFFCRMNLLIPPLESSEVANFVSASNFAMDCIKIALKHAENTWRHVPKEELERAENYYEPCPKSSISASLELLSSTSKVRKAAGVILNGRGHVLILSLGQILHTPDNDRLIAKILRHLIEDENALQTSMEASIRLSMEKKRRGIGIADSNPVFKTVSLKQFLSMFIHLACRDSAVFCKSVDNTCVIIKEGDKLNVKLASDSQRQSNIVDSHRSTCDQNSNHIDYQGKEATKSPKTSPKKASKKVPYPVSVVIDAILGRLTQASSPSFAQKMLETMAGYFSKDQQDTELKMKADTFLISQQALCINLLSELLVAFSHCVTAFLRRDADPLPDWISCKYPNKLSYHTPQNKSVKREKSSSKKSKSKMPSHSHVTKTKSPALNEGSNICFLIGSIIKHQISYHGSAGIVQMRQSLSKDACSLLIALAQRSTEGQRRVCQEIQLILHSFAYPGQGNPSNFIAIRSLEKKDTRSPSPDLEGSLVLLATLLSVPGQVLSPGSHDSYHKEIVERLINAGLVTVLVDAICRLDLSDQNDDRLKVLLSAIIRSLEKLTSVRATAKAANDGEDKGLGMNFEDLVEQLNERGWHIAGEDENVEDAMDDSNNDDGMHTDSDEMDLSDSASYHSEPYSSSYLSDSYPSVNSEGDGWSFSDGDSGEIGSENEDPLAVDVYSSDSDESMGDESDDQMSDSDNEEDEEGEDIIRDYEYDLDDIFPPEEAELDIEHVGLRNPSRLMQAWDRGVSVDGPFGPSIHHINLESQEGDSDEEDIFLDGNDEIGEEYYSDEEYEEDAPSPFADDRLISAHTFANTSIPGFWIQEGDGERASNWRDQDPLFGTAFISSRLLTPHQGPFRSHRNQQIVEVPASGYNHPLIARPNNLEILASISGRPIGIRPFSISNEPLFTSRLAHFRGWLPGGEARGALGQPVGLLRSQVFNYQHRTPDQFPDRLAERYATAIDVSLGGRPETGDGGSRQRDRLDLAIDRFEREDADYNIFRANSPPLLRPRQRQRTDIESRDTAVESGDPGVNYSTTPQAGDNEDSPDDPNQNEDIEPIDPEFLAALPPDLQREVLENHERERRARRISRAASAVQRSNVGADQSGRYISEIVAHIPEELQGDAIIGFDSLIVPPGFGLNGEIDVPDGQTQDLPVVAREGTHITENIDNGSIRDPNGEVTAFGTGTRELLGQLGEWTVNIDGRRRRSGGRVRRFDSLSIDRLDSLNGSDRIALDTNYDTNRFGERSDSRIDVQSDSDPLLSDDQIPHLLRLLRFPRWEGRLHLNRAIRHLTESKKTSKSIFKQIFGLLRCPLSTLESQPSSLLATLSQLKHPMPSLLTDLHTYIVQNRGSSIVVNSLGLEPPEDEEDNDEGILSILVVRRLIELLRHCFNLVRRGVDNVLDTEVPCLYEVYRSMGIISKDIIDAENKDIPIPALDVLLSLPLRHDISRSNLRGISLELVSKFLHHFEKIENDIHEKEQKIMEKKRVTKNGDKNAEYPSITRLEIERLTMEHASLLEKARGPREAFKKVNKDIVRNYVMMLTYPSLKDSETDSVRIILQSLTTINLEHWNTLANAAGEFVQLLSKDASYDLEDLSNGNVANKARKPDTKGVGIFRCLQSVAEGVFQLVIDRFDPKSASLPEDASQARDIAARSLTNMLDQTKESLWGPFNRAAQFIEQNLRGESSTGNHNLPLPVRLIRPYVESYFLLHDTLRCATCSLDTLAQEVNELAEEEEAWTNKREEVSKAAQEQATASFTRIQSLDLMSPNMLVENSETKNPDKMGAPCLPSSDSDFVRFAENHRTLVNLIVSHEPSVLEESMNMLLKHSKLLDFENKRVHFRKRIQTLARQLSHHSRLALNVRRAHVFEDSFNQLRVVSKSQLRSPLKVTFSGEEGVDAGGVSREWYQVMSREMFNPAISLFEAIPQGSSTYQPNPNSVVQTDEARGISHLDYFKFVGHVVGKALLDDQVIDAHFTRSFYKHLLGQPLTYRDIEGVDPDFYKNLSWMLENDIDGVLDLTFSEESDFFGQKSVIELCPNGANIKVTDQNKRDYVDAIARHRMTNAIQPQIHAFLEGFWNVVPRISLSLFNDHELELMISGLPDVDVLDLRANCEYHGGYSAASQVILWFWEIAISMDREQRALLLQFVTGTSKVPVGGFSELQAISGRQKFQIHKAFGGTDRLPTAHTCFNQLDLPEYHTKEQLRERLLMAIHEGKEGFGFA